MSFLLVIFVLVFSTGSIQAKHYLVETDSNEHGRKEAGDDYVDFEYRINTKKGNDYATSAQQSSTDQEIKEDTKLVGGQGNDYASPQELDQFLKEQEKELEEFLSDKEKDEEDKGTK